MGCRIDGFRQGIRYGSSAEVLWYRLRQAGADVTNPTGTPTVTYYDRNGTVIGSAANLTQDGSTGWWYHSLDASDTTVWELGEGYRAEVSWVSSSITYKDQFFIDVAKWPFNEPLWTSTEVEEVYPDLTAARPTGWSDWTKAILKAHSDLARDLRKLKDSRGRALFVHRILDRDQIKDIEEAYVYHRIVVYIIESAEEVRKDAWALLSSARKNLGNVWIDTDDDLIKEDGEEVSIGITWEH